MELNKTQCRDCGHLHRWYSYKWADTKEKRDWNLTNDSTCPKCKSTNVKNIEDDDTMGPYRFAAKIISKLIEKKKEV